MNQAHKDFYSEQRKKLVPSLIRRGIITRVNTTNWTADVQIVGSTQGVLKNLQMSSAVPITVQPGDRCLLSTQTESNQSDIVILCTYGKKPLNLNGGVVNLTFSYATGTDTSQKIPHGLPATPVIYTVNSQVTGFNYAAPASTIILLGLVVSSVDDTYLNLTMYTNTSHVGTVTLPVSWIAGII